MTGDSVQPDSCFVGSNVWLYAFDRRQDEVKPQIAKAIVAEPDRLVSTQVINEVCKNLF